MISLFLHNDLFYYHYTTKTAVQYNPVNNTNPCFHELLILNIKVFICLLYLYCDFQKMYFQEVVHINLNSTDGIFKIEGKEYKGR